jgi:hypothetical protein
MSAMLSALCSLVHDIDAGMEILHIDTTLEPPGEADPHDAMRRLLSLYQDATRYARNCGRRIEFEIGFENQREGVHDHREFEGVLKATLAELERLCLPRPLFVVAQTGTKVLETQNAGELMRIEHRARVLAEVRAIATICERFGVRLKAHNCDYLDDHAWRGLASAGIGGANVAPEYGVLETRAFLRLLERASLVTARNGFLQLACDSGAWKKWMAPGSRAGDEEKAVIAGHYVFATPRGREIRQLLGQTASGGVCAIDEILRATVQDRISRHVDHLFHVQASTPPDEAWSSR